MKKLLLLFVLLAGFVFAVSSNTFAADPVLPEQEATLAIYLAKHEDDLTRFAYANNNFVLTSWQEYNNDYISAVILPQTTGTEAIAKIAAWEVAFGKLVFKSEALLNAEVAKFDEDREDEYTEATWEAVLDVLDLIDEIHPVTHTDAMVVTLKNQLVAAMAALEFVAQEDLDEALAKIDAVKALDDDTQEETYTAASLLAFFLQDAVVGAMLETTNVEVEAKGDAYLAMLDLLVFKNQAEYDAALAAAMAIDEDDYTALSYAAITAALALPSSTKAQVDAKIDALVAAVEGLVSIFEENLIMAKEAVFSVVGPEYTPASWMAFLVDFNVAIRLPEQTTAEVVAKTEALDAAYAKLVFTNRAALNTLMAQANSLVEAHYTEATWEDLEEAVALPCGTFAQVAAKIAAVTNARAALVLVNMVDLVAIKAEYVAANYTNASWTLAANVTRRNNITAMPEATFANVNAKIAAIEVAIDLLVFAEQPAYDAVIIDAQNVEFAMYTQYSIMLFIDAYLEALELEVTYNSDLVDKVDAINDAIALLDEKVAYETALAAIVLFIELNVDVLDEEDYTAFTWAALEEAMLLPTRTIEEINEKDTNVQDALTSIKLVVKTASVAISPASPYVVGDLITFTVTTDGEDAQFLFIIRDTLTGYSRSVGSYETNTNVFVFDTTDYYPASWLIEVRIMNNGDQTHTLRLFPRVSIS